LSFNIQFAVFLYTQCAMSYLKAKLLSTNPEASYLTRIILKIIKEQNPQSVRRLTKILTESLDLTEEEVIKSILKLQADGIINFKNQFSKSWSFGTYLKTSEAIWYWLTITSGLLAATFVFVISENVYPWIYARNVLGLLFVLFLPGYALVKTLFQGEISGKLSMENLTAIERIALSVAMSFGLVSIVGIILYYSPLDMDLSTIVFGLLGLTLVFSTAAVTMEYQAKKKDLNDNLPLSVNES
jgi:hypothetical protein